MVQTDPVDANPKDYTAPPHERATRRCGPGPGVDGETCGTVVRDARIAPAPAFARGQVRGAAGPDHRWSGSGDPAQAPHDRRQEPRGKRQHAQQRRDRPREEREQAARRP